MGTKKTRSIGIRKKSNYLQRSVHPTSNPLVHELTDEEDDSPQGAQRTSGGKQPVQIETTGFKCDLDLSKETAPPSVDILSPSVPPTYATFGWDGHCSQTKTNSISHHQIVVEIVFTNGVKYTYTGTKHGNFKQTVEHNCNYQPHTLLHMQQGCSSTDFVYCVKLVDTTGDCTRLQQILKTGVQYWDRTYRQMVHAEIHRGDALYKVHVWK